MKKYVFNDTTIHELHRSAKMLYETFSRADKVVAESNFTWCHNEEIDYSVSPHKYYNFRFGRFEVFIHQFKNKRYSLECYGFKPDNLKPYDVNKFNYEFYRNLYGNFGSFGEAQIAFADCVNQLVQLKTKPLF